MRITLVIVLAVGLLLIGLSVCGTRIANEHSAVDLDVQQELATLAKKAPAQSIDFLSREQEASLDDIALLRKGWLAVALCGTILSAVSVSCIIVQKRTSREIAIAQQSAST